MTRVYKRTSLLVSLGFGHDFVVDDGFSFLVRPGTFGSFSGCESPRRGHGSACPDNGGGWCQSLEACANRAQSFFGSSKYMKPFVKFDGLLSSSVQVNPEFFNWTHVLVRYCDGASFSANVSDTLAVLYFRGKRIFEAVIEELKLYRGLSDANQVLLSGCSAGGLAAIHRCNDMCYFPQVMKDYVKPPLFILNAAYDFWQSPAQAVGDWYFQRNGEAGQQAIDCAYPCNPTCVSIFD
ncbi:pectin acetylesterase 12-like [Selaginella moellendorffii]|uniref:pectin acetylesterase 12-like n=1 Tax=Selaginella moellendorffii TaxID=88036 RepID=UPI000D1D00BC|nr:pectin acetylesterase 12-like [Selaginella moellendorffii]|eukprot:XP_024528546.1 pectin acetylesterase 12-like [Selaginella moellendorffii]